MIAIICCVTRHVMTLTLCHLSHALHHDLAIHNMALSLSLLHVVTMSRFPTCLSLCFAALVLYTTLLSYFLILMQPYVWSYPTMTLCPQHVYPLHKALFSFTSYQSFVLALGCPLGMYYYFKALVLSSPRISIFWFWSIHIPPLKRTLSDFHSYKRRYHICLNRLNIFIKS